MEWLSQHWIWIVIAVLVVGLMHRGGGMGCGMGHAHARTGEEPKRDGPKDGHEGHAQRHGGC